MLFASTRVLLIPFCMRPSCLRRRCAQNQSNLFLTERKMKEETRKNWKKRCQWALTEYRFVREKWRRSRVVGPTIFCRPGGLRAHRRCQRMCVCLQLKNPSCSSPSPTNVHSFAIEEPIVFKHSRQLLRRRRPPAQQRQRKRPQ